MNQNDIEDFDDTEIEEILDRRPRAWKIAVNVILMLTAIAVIAYRPALYWYNKPSGVVGSGECTVQHKGFVSMYNARIIMPDSKQQEPEPPGAKAVISTATNGTGLSYLYACYAADDPYNGKYLDR